MTTRLRQRAPHTAVTSPSTHLPIRPSPGRVTRHASIRNYADPSSGDDDDDDDVEEEEEKQEDDGHNSDDDDESLSTDESSQDEDAVSDADFAIRQRPSKRPRTNDPYSTNNSPSKRRKQPRRRATAESVPGRNIGLPTSPDSVALSRPRRSVAAPAASTSVVPSAPSTPSPRKIVRTGRDQKLKQTPTKRNNQTVISPRAAHPQTPNSKSATGKRNSPQKPTKSLPWDTLPYMVIVSILAYAAGPLDKITSVRWLLAASRTCRTFIEPGLRVLYENPPLLTMNMAHSLADMLTRKRQKPMFSYNQKVRTLSIDVGSLASHSYKGRRLDIANLVAHCPRLIHLDLYHYSDGPPFREQPESVRWAYPDSLFEALGAPLTPVDELNVDGADSRGGGDGNVTSSNTHENGLQSEGSAGSSADLPVAAPSLPVAPLALAPAPTAIKLQSWRWNLRMWGPNINLHVARALHQTPTFAGLKKLSLVNFSCAAMSKPVPASESQSSLSREEQSAENFAGLLNVLPNLKHLEMTSCSVVNEFLLPLLPKTLEHLELVSCNEVTAIPFASYLVTHGQNLRQLTLHHNRSLSLEFLTVLGTACPQLQALCMNLTYYSRLQFSGDSGPLYSTLLTEHQAPTWPESIRVIELENLRKWEPAAADAFFQSLVDSAPHILQLRVLVIKAMLNIPWRQRCEMRDKWTSMLMRVFKRRSLTPEPADSLAYYSNLKKKMKKDKNQSLEDEAEPSRRSHRIATTLSPASGLASQLRKKAANGRMSYREPDTDEDIELSVSEDEEDRSDKEESGEINVGNHGHRRGSKGEEVPFVHGMCDVVDIRFDNQKPVEFQYTMMDFQESDNDTSDEEWAGDGGHADDYAW